MKIIKKVLKVGTSAGIIIDKVFLASNKLKIGDYIEISGIKKVTKK